MKKLSLLLVLLSLNAFAVGKHRPIPAPVPSVAPSAMPSVIPSEAPSPAPSVIPVGGNVILAPDDYYTTPAQRVKILAGGKKMNEVIQSQCFADFMTARQMINTKGKTSSEVTADLQSLSGTIPVVMYYAPLSKAMAYRQPPSLTIHLNTKYYGTGNSDCDYASVIAHESVGHSLGSYEHTYKWTPTRPFSVPYSINSAFSFCCK